MADLHVERNPLDDEARARELYKYFRPTEHASAPLDTVLTAHVQLVAWRLNAERAMVSYIDEETQYFVAESTKTLHLDNALRYDDPDDAIWAGCIKVPKAGRLCEHTIAALPPLDGGVACFEVLDLTKDPRFSTLGFVRGPPHFKSYVGVPLRTRSGINIGSLFIIDSKLRAPVTETDRQFLGVMANNIIQHLEMLKDRKDHQRTTVMSLCMSAYVDPENHNQKRMRRANLQSTSGANSPFLINKADPQSDNTRTVDEAGHSETFGRAADLLAEALDLEGGGGVVFLDTLSAVQLPQPYSEHTSEDETNDSQQSHTKERVDSHHSITDDTSEPAAQFKSRPRYTERSASYNRVTEVLAHAYQSSEESIFSNLLTKRFSPLSPGDLSKLIERYPRGKLFTFDKEGHILSNSSDDQAEVQDTRKSSRTQRMNELKSEADLLQYHFPTARQIIFLPLWDPTTSRSSACFVYNCSEYRNFTHTTELVYCITFCNCVMSEIARLAISQADQQKSDFIGSVSHELRSPLHGILASCEFLGDTECTSFQRSLVDTADSCARTLLDTISMVLDYSKINSFEKNINRTRKSKRDGASKGTPKDMQSSLNIYRDVNLAVMTEEVVEGVATGHTFDKRFVDGDTNDLIDADFHGKGSKPPSDGVPRKANVKIIVDIPTRSWTYWGQPGALRRIVMNLFGNSLKYTKQGFVHIKLEAQEAENSSDPNEHELVTLTITDSGQGISPAYLKNKLFTPFAQESNLTPGTGLGLSLVKSIVNMLGGKIDVESTLGVGTKVTVKLPMMKSTPNGISNGLNSNPSYSGNDVERIKGESIDLLKSQAKDKTVALYCSEKEYATDHETATAQIMRKSLVTYLEGWYGFSVQPWQESSISDVVVCEESELGTFMNAAPEIFAPGCRTMVLVLCNTASAQDIETALAHCNNIEEIRYPLGPYKFARALNICFERLLPSDTSMCAPYSPSEACTKASMKTPMGEAIRAVEHMTILDTHSLPCEISITETETCAFRGHSTAAKMALSRANSIDSPIAVENGQSKISTVLSHNIGPRINDRNFSRPDISVLPSPGTRQSEVLSTVPPTCNGTNSFFNDNATASNDSQAPAFKISTTQGPPNRSPRMLLVDDNNINLKLLQVFMKKRKYTAVTKAEDGLQAVNAYQSSLDESPPAPPDIILMDISMPIMDGFEATRRIREIEREHNQQLPSTETPKNCLIIALTGLASDRDQKEAFRSGVNLYITKPVSFAKVSKLLDNWEANGKTAAPQSLSGSFVIAGDSVTP